MSLQELKTYCEDILYEYNFPIFKTLLSFIENLICESLTLYELQSMDIELIRIEKIIDKNLIKSIRIFNYQQQEKYKNQELENQKLKKNKIQELEYQDLLQIHIKEHFDFVSTHEVEDMDYSLGYGYFKQESDTYNERNYTYDMYVLNMDYIKKKQTIEINYLKKRHILESNNINNNIIKQLYILKYKTQEELHKCEKQRLEQQHAVNEYHQLKKCLTKEEIIILKFNAFKEFEELHNKQSKELLNIIYNIPFL
jgi:hypothetical protein